MIIFKNDKIEIDLSRSGVSLNEESNLFTDNLYKSYSLPFSIEADNELLAKLGIPYLDNITNVETGIKGKLILPDRYYNATLFLGEIQGERINCDLSYGDEELPVFDMKLKSLPWPLILAPSVRDYAAQAIQKTWPDTPCNFPMVYYPEIAENDGYEHFENFTNNYTNNMFKENFTSGTGEDTVYHNINVLAPYPYLLEILRFGFSLEGRTIKGPVVDHEVLRKTVCISENYLEKFRGSEYQAFSFDVPNETEVTSFATLGVYKRQFTIQAAGTYDLQLKFNMDPVMASYFELKIFREDSTTGEQSQLHYAKSTNNRVSIEKELTINITDAMVFDYIKIELRLPYTSQSIASFNSFEFSLQGGKLNEFPTFFNLSDFMPDMTFGEFVNELKNWLNLDFMIRDAEVYIDFTQDSILNKHREDHRHLEIPKPKKNHNSNRLYKLKSADGEEIIFNHNGQIYSDRDEKGMTVVSIDMNVQPVLVEKNAANKIPSYNVTTGVLPEDIDGITFAVFDGLEWGKPVCSAELTQELSLQSVFNNYWADWLRYRVNSKTFKETFECSVYERINIDELSFKYNELHVIKKLRKKFISENVMQVEVESETF